MSLHALLSLPAFLSVPQFLTLHALLSLPTFLSLPPVLEGSLDPELRVEPLASHRTAAASVFPCVGGSRVLPEETRLWAIAEEKARKNLSFRPPLPTLPTSHLSG